MLPGPFAYAERWDEKSDTYLGLAIERAANAVIVIDSDSVIIKPAVAEAHRPAPSQPVLPTGAPMELATALRPPAVRCRRWSDIASGRKQADPFTGAVMISAERPARNIHQIVEAIIEQLTTLPGSEVKLRLEIDAEVPSGLERAKVRRLSKTPTLSGS